MEVRANDGRTSSLGMTLRTKIPENRVFLLPGSHFTPLGSYSEILNSAGLQKLGDEPSQALVLTLMFSLHYTSKGQEQEVRRGQVCVVPSSKSFLTFTPLGSSPPVPRLPLHEASPGFQDSRDGRGRCCLRDSG